MKILMIPSGIKPATLRLLARCLNQLRHRVLHYPNRLSFCENYVILVLAYESNLFNGCRASSHSFILPLGLCLIYINLLFNLIPTSTPLPYTHKHTDRFLPALLTGESMSLHLQPLQFSYVTDAEYICYKKQA
jgi:hypothetical protein